MTPRDLEDDGLYHDLAVALMAGIHRSVSMGLLARKLGAQTRRVLYRVPVLSPS